MRVLVCDTDSGRIAIDVLNVVEVVPWVRVERIAGSSPATVGSMSFHGNPVVVIDPAVRLGSDRHAASLDDRIVVTATRGDGMVGLLARGIEFAEVESTGHDPRGRGFPPIIGALVRDASNELPLIDADALRMEEVR